MRRSCDVYRKSAPRHLHALRPRVVVHVDQLASVVARRVGGAQDSAPSRPRAMKPLFHLRCVLMLVLTVAGGCTDAAGGPLQGYVEGEFVFTVADEAANLGTRESGRQIRNKVRNLTQVEDERVAIDFSAWKWSHPHLPTSSLPSSPQSLVGTGSIADMCCAA